MIPTFIGVAVAAIGILLLLRGGPTSLMAMLMACSLMPGSAALLLPALGGSTIPPIHFALVFALLGLLVGHPRFDLLRAALVQNSALLCYAFYAVAIALIGPRMFQGQMYVIPMKLAFSGKGLHTSPLAPNPQNLTSAVYLVGTLLISVCVSAAILHEGGLRRFVKTAVVVAWIMIFLGVSGSLLAGTPWTDFLDLFRNGSYAQTEQNFETISRIKGIAPEPSTYATSALIWFVFLFECWSRDVMPRATGPVAAAMALVLIFSTSTTAYVGIAVYGMMFALRTVLVPRSLAFGKIIALAACGLLAVVGVAAAFMMLPAFANLFVEMITAMTVGKTSSESAVERTQWAAQGIEAFRLSHGLGVGPGSFRSSSFVTAVLGTTGVIGAVAMAAHLIRVFRPLRPSTYLRTDDGGTAVGVAASWAAIAVMVPASLTSPSGDPGPDFAILAGAALALRWRAYRNARISAEEAIDAHRTQIALPAPMGARPRLTVG